MQHEQVDTSLIITGGYAYSASACDHTTYSNLIVVDVPGTISAIINGRSIKPHFIQKQDAFFQLTGGQMEYLNDTFYLVGGQKFIGRYNPMGPSHGLGFIQEYTNDIRKFCLENNK